MTAEQLQTWCASSADVRAWLHAPWEHEGRVYATDGSALISMDAALDGFQRAEGHQVHASARISTWLADTAGTPTAIDATTLPERRACPDCTGSGVVRKFPCRSCDGQGEFEHHGHDYTCRACDGDGFIGFATDASDPKAQHCASCKGMGEAAQSTPLAGVLFDVRYLRRIATLPGAVMHVRPANDLQPSVFTFDGGAGAVMPMLGGGR